MTTTTLTVTAETTVAQMIEAGVTLSQLQALVTRAASGEPSSDRAEFAEEVYAIMCDQPHANWKNGIILKTWFPNGKESDAEREAARVKRHQMISRALADLTKDGRITKERSGNSASSTFYKLVEAKLPAAESTDDAADGAADDGAQDS